MDPIDDPEKTSAWGGRIAILLIFGGAAAMGGFAWWIQYNRSDQVRGLWGTGTVRLLQNAPQAKLWRLVPAEGAGENRLTIQGRDWMLVDEQNVHGAPGWLHARNALMEDNNYDLSAAPGAGEWQYLLELSNGEDNTARLAIDTVNGLACELQSGRTLVFTKPAYDAFSKFFGKQERSEPKAADASASESTAR